MNRKCWMKKITSTLTAAVMAVSIFTPGVVFAADDNPNLALNKTATASSTEHTNFPPSEAFDGIRTGDASRWSSQTLSDSAPQWLSVDLGSSQKVKEIDIYWRHGVSDTSAGLNYTIETSANGTDWSAAETVSMTETELMEALADTPIRYVFEDGISARHIRVHITKGYFSLPTYKYISIYELEVYGEVLTVDPNPNLALGKPATSSANEATSLTPNLAVDGNKAHASRWSSGNWRDETTGKPQWITVDLGKKRPIKEVNIYWEAAAGREFVIEVSDDKNTWTNVQTVNMSQTDPVPSPSQYILADGVQGRYLRVYITKGTTSVWSSVAIYELEVYGAEKENIGDVLAAIDPKVSGDSKSLKWTANAYPNYEFTIIGSDAKEIVALDGTVTQPLVDKTVNMIVRVENKNDSTEFSEGNYTVKIPGEKSSSSGNAEPTVIPSLREWSGGSGDLMINASSSIVIDDEELRDAAEYTQADFVDLFGFEPDIETGTPQDGDIFLSLDSGESALREEGYRMTVDGYVTIAAPAVTGAFYGTRSVLQILKASGDMTIPKGEARDYPKYEYRGIQMDVARKFIPLYFLQDYLKLMSWYKMNFINVHLNDNGFPSYFNNDWSQTYSAFRLESETYPGLTSTDGSYSKEEFRDLQIEGKAVGVDVIPEIDTPGHSLALTQYRPSLWSDITNKNFAKDHLDILKPENVEFMTDLFEEYLKDGTFIDKVNIGTDEYSSATDEINEAFRSYTDKLLTLVKEYDKQPWLWGALSANPGDTYVDPEGATMLVWSNGYANPNTMANDGWDMISINENQTYIVPAAGYYSDYQDSISRYNDWEANKFGGVTFSTAHPGVKGGALGVWNDIVGNGISSDDIHDRVMPLMTVFAEKLWQGGRSDAVKIEEFTERANVIGEAPRANISWRYENVPDNVIMDIPFDGEFENKADFEVDLSNVTGVNIVDDPERGKVAQFDGGESYIKTSVENVGFGQSTQFNDDDATANLAPDEGWTLSMSIKPDEDNPEDSVLFESSKGTVKLNQTDTGQIGFSKEVFENFVLKDNYNHRFDYEVPEGVWTDIVMVGNNRGTSLYVNSMLVEKLEKAGVPGLTGTGGELTRAYMETLVLPTATIGSETNSFSGLMDDLKIYNRTFSAEEIREMYGEDYATIPLDGATFTDGSHQDNSSVFAKAFDGDTGTIWHTLWNGTPRENHWGNIHFDTPTAVDGLRYLPRQAGGTNGIITEYEIQVSFDNGQTYKSVATGNWEWDRKSTALKFINFEPQEAVTDVKLISVNSLSEATDGKLFSSAAEISLTRPMPKFTGTPVFTDTDNGTALSDLTAKNMDVTYVYKNETGSAQNLKMFAAVYSPEGKLLHTAATAAQPAGKGLTTVFNVTLEMPENIEGLYTQEDYSAAVFLWDSTTLVPIMNKFDF